MELQIFEHKTVQRVYGGACLRENYRMPARGTGECPHCELILTANLELGEDLEAALAEGLQHTKPQGLLGFADPEELREKVLLTDDEQQLMFATRGPAFACYQQGAAAGIRSLYRSA